jgi:hypothetical protein
MLLRLRQACDHPLLTLPKQLPLQQSATQASSSAVKSNTFADIDELLSRFLHGGMSARSAR